MRLLGGSNGRAITDRANYRANHNYFMGFNRMDLKAKLAKAKKVEAIRTEMATYEDAVNNKHKFADFYHGKWLELKAKLEAI